MSEQQRREKVASSQLRVVIDKLGKQLNKLHLKAQAQEPENLDETWNNAEELHAELAALLQTTDVKRALYADLDKNLSIDGKEEFRLQTWTTAALVTPHGVEVHEITVPLPAMGTEVDDGDEGTAGDRDLNGEFVVTLKALDEIVPHQDSYQGDAGGAPAASGFSLGSFAGFKGGHRRSSARKRQRAKKGTHRGKSRRTRRKKPAAKRTARRPRRGRTRTKHANK
jgi:hypothetical protein